ncbi:hypothetical protein, partial [Chondromyces apiculatus]|uniref:hypothetical protein n=1 Tax=Chondromyces apiculatus TaxID=51 RepID=UPI0005C43A2D
TLAADAATLAADAATLAALTTAGPADATAGPADATLAADAATLATDATAGPADAAALTLATGPTGATGPGDLGDQTAVGGHDELTASGRHCETAEEGSSPTECVS